MSKSLILLMLVVMIGLAGLGVWISLVQSDPAPASGSTNTEGQKRARDFFGSGKRYDMENGQEMRPRW